MHNFPLYMFQFCSSNCCLSHNCLQYITMHRMFFGILFTVSLSGFTFSDSDTVASATTVSFLCMFSSGTFLMSMGDTVGHGCMGLDVYIYVVYGGGDEVFQHNTK